MADANIFAQYLRPMKTVADYQAEGDAADLRRQQLIGAQRQNALAALTAQQTQAQLQDAADKRNALQGIYQRLGPNADPAALEGALLSNPLTMEQGIAFQRHRADIDKTRAEAAAKSADVWSKAMTLQGELAKQVIANPTRETAMAAIDQMEAAAKQLGLPLQFQQTRASIAAAQSPDEIRKWAFASGVTAEKLLPHLQTTDYGGFKRQEAVDPVTGRVTATAPDVKLTVAPNTAATIAAENQRQRERLAQEKELAGQGGSVIDTDQGKMWVPNKPQPGSVIRATPVIGPTGLQPLQGPQKQLPEAAQKQVVGARNLQDAIANYQEKLADWSNRKMLSPDSRLKMGNAYNNMMLQAKEAYNLGVLNGPDYDILQKVVMDPTNAQAAVVSNEALSGQASELDRIAKGIERTVLETHGQRYTPRSPSGKPASGAKPTVSNW